MVKYIRAELYKVLHRRYTYIFLLVMLACEALLVAGWVFTNARGNSVDFNTGAGMLAMMLSTGLYCTVLTGDLVFSDQYKVGTLKNEVSYGISRTHLYLGKLVVECLSALALCAVMVAFYIGLCWVALPHTPEANASTMQMIGYCLLSALPLWLGCQALSNMCMFLFKNSTVASFVIIGVLMALPQVLKLLGALVSRVFAVLYDVMLTTPFDIAHTVVGDWGFVGRSCLIGLVWFAAATIVGVLVFRKKEIV